MKGFWKLATLLRWWMLLALEMERRQQQQMKAVEGWASEVRGVAAAVTGVSQH